MGVLDNLYGKVYYLKIKKETLDRFRTTEREEYNKEIDKIKKKINDLKNPPPEKRMVIDELLKLRSDLPIIYTDPIVELSKFTLEELKHHLERVRKGYRFFDNAAVREIRINLKEKTGQKICAPSIKDLVLKHIKEKDFTLDELVEKTKGKPTTVKSILTYSLKKQGYKINTYKENGLEKYKFCGYLETQIEPVVEEEKTVEASPEPNTNILPEITKPKVSYPKEGVFNFIVALMKEKAYSMNELAELSGATLGTIKQNILYTARNKGVVIVSVAIPGCNELKYQLNRSEGN